MSRDRYHFLADPKNTKAQEVMATFLHSYKQHDLEKADVVVALGGDGFMLHTLHKAMDLGIPVFGLNFGSVGFLMNVFDGSALKKRIQDALSVDISPLKMKATYCANADDESSSASCASETYYALNEVSLLRQLHQAARIRVSVDEQVRLDELTGDGIIVATAAGSTAYNSSASGPILPLTSNLMAITPISPFRPRRWRGALVPDDVVIKLEVLEPEKRPVSVSADYQEARNICFVEISKEKSKKVTLLYDCHQTLGDRLIDEQFAV